MAGRAATAAIKIPGFLGGPSATTDHNDIMYHYGHVDSFPSGAVRAVPFFVGCRPLGAPAARRQAPRQADEHGTKTEYPIALTRRGELGARRERSFAERLGVESMAFSARKGFPYPNRAAPLKTI